MFPCANPQVCGVQNHRDGTICKATQGKSALRLSGQLKNISVPQSASGSPNVSSIDPAEFERRSNILREHLDNYDADHAVPYAYHPEDMSVASLVTMDTDETEYPVRKGQYVIEALEGDDGDDNHPDGNFYEVSTDIEDEKPRLEDGWVRY